jgi:predicted patatin/cPLA2 family phospholipase
MFVITALAAFGLVCEKGGVKNAFTTAMLDQNIFICIAPRYVDQTVLCGTVL